MKILMTRNGVNNILRKYVNMAKKKDVKLIPDGLSYHSLRHSGESGIYFRSGKKCL